MSWEVVARKDVRDALRSRVLLGLSVFFVVLLGGSSAAFGYVVGGDVSSKALFGLFGRGRIFQFSYTGFLGFLLGFIAIVASYAAVVGERESGTLKLLLSLPHSRRDVVLGKLLGRSVVVTVPAAAGFLVAIVALLATGVSVDWATVVPQALLTVLLGVAFVAIAVGISAGTDTTRQTILSTLGLYFAFVLLWSSLATAVASLLSELAKRLPGVSALDAATQVKISLFVKYLNPLRAYETLVASLYFDSTLQARLVQAGFRERIVAAQTMKGSVPAYLSDPVVLLVLLGWVVIPPVLGYLAFEAADL
ncbi:MAG: ABC transporter permease [Haloarculaceae archaeon]